MPLTSGINSSSFSLGMEVLRAQVAATGRGEFTMGEPPRESWRLNFLRKR